MKMYTKQQLVDAQTKWNEELSKTPEKFWTPEELHQRMTDKGTAEKQIDTLLGYVTD